MTLKLAVSRSQPPVPYWADLFLVFIIRIYYIVQPQILQTHWLIVAVYCQGSLTVELADTHKSKQSSNSGVKKPSLPPGSRQLNRQRKMDFKKVKKQRRRAGKGASLTRLTWRFSRQNIRLLCTCIDSWHKGRSVELRKNQPRTGLAVDSYLLPTSKSRDTKTRTKIRHQ